MAGSVYSKEFRENQQIVTSFHMSYKKEIMSLLSQFCEICGTNEDLILHHDRYELNLYLKNFRIFCRKCHYNFHKHRLKELKKRRRIEKSKKEDMDKVNKLKEYQNIDEQNVKNFFFKVAGVDPESVVEIELTGKKGKQYSFSDEEIWGRRKSRWRK